MEQTLKCTFHSLCVYICIHRKLARESLALKVDLYLNKGSSYLQMKVHSISKCFMVNNSFEDFHFTFAQDDIKRAKNKKKKWKAKKRHKEKEEKRNLAVEGDGGEDDDDDDDDDDDEDVARISSVRDIRERR